MMQIVFDNYNASHPNLKALWGFSAYFKTYGLLFDTGSNGRVLLKNLNALKIDVTAIRYVFISHSHWDHIGGLDSIIELNPNITLFVPKSLSKHLIADLKGMVKEVVIIAKTPQRLFDNLYSTGLLGDEMPEQSLIIDGKEPALITGCGHYGIENIAASASKVIGKNISLCAGGFHLKGCDETAIMNTIVQLKEQGVSRVCPTHCSGDKAIMMFAEAFADACIAGGIGTLITL